MDQGPCGDGSREAKPSPGASKPGSPSGIAGGSGTLVTATGFGFAAAFIVSCPCPFERPQGDRAIRQRLRRTAMDFREAKLPGVVVDDPFIPTSRRIASRYLACDTNEVSAPRS
jgi:hypothetical protein